MRTILIVVMIVVAVYATDWQVPVELGYPEKVSGICFSGDNLTMYGDKLNGVYKGDIYYLEWNGSSWIDMGWIEGDVNSFDSEGEPFMTYDGQSLYFLRKKGTDYSIYVADWEEGSGFIDSEELGPQVNDYANGNAGPSITQDGQKLYFSGGKAYESTWNGSDWDEAVLLPDEINGGGGDRLHVTISPDGNEIYFTGAGPWSNRFAVSKKVNGEWQQWYYLSFNINPEPGAPNPTMSCPALTHAPYETQELYFNRGTTFGKTWHALRSPIAVQPSSVGNIKTLYR